jgi:serine-threonine kinase receptor-associated protein
LNADATRAATGGGDSVAKIWDATTGVELRSFDHKHIVKGVALDSTSTRLATACSDKHVRVFDLSSDSTTPILDVALSGQCRAVLWSADDSALYVPSGDIFFKVDVDTGVASGSLPLAGEVQDMAWVGKAAAGQLCLAAGKSAVFIDAAKMVVTASHELGYVVETVACHPAHPGAFLTGSKDDVWIRAHSTKDGTEIAQLEGHHGPVHVVRFTNEGGRFVTGSDDSTVRIWPVGSILT